MSNEEACYSLLTALSSALEAQKVDEIDRILDELSAEALNTKAKEALEKISDEVLMAEYCKAKELLKDLMEDV